MFSFRHISSGRTIWLMFCSLATALWGSELWTVKTQPGTYTDLWNSEGPVAGVWYYASEQLYTLHLVALLIWFGCGVLLSLYQGPYSKKLLTVHVLLSMLWVIVSLCQSAV